jgi:hypothetical protein
MNSPVEPPDLAAVGSPPAAADPSCDEPASGPDQVEDRPSQSQNPLPMIDPSEIDVSDWEVASP